MFFVHGVCSEEIPALPLGQQICFLCRSPRTIIPSKQTIPHRMHYMMVVDPNGIWFHNCSQEGKNSHSCRSYVKNSKWGRTSWGGWWTAQCSSVYDRFSARVGRKHLLLSNKWIDAQKNTKVRLMLANLFSDIAKSVKRCIASELQNHKIGTKYPYQD